jgi:phosphinothricin acetyltransferase
LSAAHDYETCMSFRETTKAIGIREATDADLPSIVEIVNLAITSLPYVWTELLTTMDARRRWLEEHREAGFPVFVAVDPDDAAIIGWSSLSPFRPRDGYRFTAEVSIYVHPRAHRRGIATRLVRQTETAAAARELHALVAVIDAEHLASVALFERFGYVERGRLPEVGRKFGAWRDEVFMVKLLEGAGGTHAA